MAIAILTHGESDGRIHGAGAGDDLIQLDSLFEPLKHGRKLKGKPILIFIQVSLFAVAILFPFDTFRLG